ncbi:MULTISPECIES: TIGR03118 family protein [unclassified Rhodococcus (in: high G+C Gram-positive bacteria)]|uniref:TIGR03118 family protein n=1 Tax=unclassified Rhodococcus (in: high G+C Gram-positive bacteria) TaxID=192944 RepID=UPI00163B4AB0|nr:MULTISPECIES: TIGR03118 family protein [unclassified Rhodococcus (in: high G+C Gram-positive bacteria)]MBC2641222.1 TIGR03118 family protein [Rhodococcus sp. 3A]MBC2894032.1 TIGR03118 family protein [Rhodococcus sp. 4CII]
MKNFCARPALPWAALLATAVASTAACAPAASSETALTPVPGNHYARTTLVANDADYAAAATVPEMVNAWGVAIRPQGEGGHFWVGAGGNSFEFVGDVSAAPDPALRTLHQDMLHEVAVPGADADTSDASVGKTTGVVFNPAPLNSDSFVVTGQPVAVDGRQELLAGSSRFLFATDSGRISGWTEQGADGRIVRQDGPAKEMFDGGPQGMNFFGLALAPGRDDALWVADFGAAPQIRQFDKTWQPVATQGFANPFATGDLIDPTDPAQGKQARPGDPAPFNIATAGNRVFVTYATTKAAEDGSGFDAGEEDSLDAEQEAATGDRPDRGKVAEFDAEGTLVRILDDQGRLNAPWGVAVAPAEFGALAGKILVGNFGGAGRIAAFDDQSGAFVDYVRDEAGDIVAVEGLWGLLFGNGESLGDSDSLYFTAGPADEKDGVFGRLRATH